MARGIHRLDALVVGKKRLKPGLYADGGNLYLQITPSGARSWLFRYMMNGRARAMGLGSVHNVPLADARDLAYQARRQLKLEGKDPLDLRRQLDAQKQVEEARQTTFDQCAEAYIDAHQDGWRNPKHREQWKNTLTTYASPKIGSLAVSKVEMSHVFAVLEPIWRTKPETASRLRGRIERVLEFAKVRGYREGENPARWQDGLRSQLPAKTQIRAVRHHPAMPYADVPKLIKDLRSRPSISALALEFTILTAARTGETTGAKWSEIDLEERIWTVPAERMKAKRPHRVPLSARALQLLRELPRDESGYVFPGGRAGRPISNAAMSELFKDLRPGFTVHGFRSCFRDWTGNETSHPREIAEAALGHVVGNKVEAAYRRADALDKRRHLMRDWASFIGQHTDEHTPSCADTIRDNALTSEPPSSIHS